MWQASDACLGTHFFLKLISQTVSFYYIVGQDLRLGPHNQQNFLGGEALCDTSAVFAFNCWLWLFYFCLSWLRINCLSLFQSISLYSILSQFISWSLFSALYFSFWSGPNRVRAVIGLDPIFPHQMVTPTWLELRKGKTDGKRRTPAPVTPSTWGHCPCAHN